MDESVDLVESKIDRPLNIESELQSSLDDYTNQLLEKDSVQNDEILKAKILKTKQFFISEDEDKKLTPITRIAEVFKCLEIPEGREDRMAFEDSIKKVGKELIHRAFDQHFENPEKYVSHGFDHSIRVTDFLQSIVKNSPGVLQFIMQEYSLEEGEANFILQIAGLFHDMGYSTLSETNNKVAHSIASLRIIAEPSFQEQLRKLFKCSEENKDKLLYDLEGAVLFHNADVLETSFDTKITTIKGEFLGLANKDLVAKVLFYYDDLKNKDPRYDWVDLSNIVISVKNESLKDEIENHLKEAFKARGYSINSIPKVVWTREENSTSIEDLIFKGRKTDLFPGDKSIGIEYRKADTLGYSLLASLRIADTSDMTFARLSYIQRKPAFIQICQKLFLEGEDGLSEKGRIIVNKIISEHKDLKEDDINTIKRISMSLNAESFKHFGGCLAIKSVEYSNAENDPLKGEIKVSVNRAIFEKLKRYKIKEKIRIKEEIRELDLTVAEYQILRLFETTLENYHGGKQIEIIVTDENGELIENSFKAMQ